MSGEWEPGPLREALGMRFQEVISEDRIRARVAELGRELTHVYRASDDLLVLGVLRGSCIFMADLIREIDLPLELDVVRTSSYGMGTVSLGRVRSWIDEELVVEGRDLLLIEDIVDGGATLRHLLPALWAKAPRSLEVCVLLHKRTSGLETEPRWVGFEAPPSFLVGYGLDQGGRYRNLPFIGTPMASES